MSNVKMVNLPLSHCPLYTLSIGFQYGVESEPRGYEIIPSARCICSSLCDLIKFRINEYYINERFELRSHFTSITLGTFITFRARIYAT